MVDSEYSSVNYKTSKISIETIMKNPEILRLFLDHVKTKKMCKSSFKKLLFVIKYVSD